MNEYAILVVSLAGIVVLVGASSALSTARKLRRSLYASGDLSRSQLAAIELAVLRKEELPADPTKRAMVLKWAREEARLGPRALRWQPFQFLGLAVAAVAIYLIPAVGFLIGVVAQALIILLGAITYAVGRRGIRLSRELLGRYDEPS
jgi:Flp pilus assembly protein TadB